MADNKGEKKMANNNWVDVSTNDAVIVIALACIVTFLIYLGFQLAPTGIPQ